MASTKKSSKSSSYFKLTSLQFNEKTLMVVLLVILIVSAGMLVLRETKQQKPSIGEAYSETKSE